MASLQDINHHNHSEENTVMASDHEQDVEKQADNAQPDQETKPTPPPATGWGSDAPDGGYEAWMTLAGSFCVLFCSFGWINSIGVFQDYYQSVLLKQYSASTIAWIPSLQVFFMFFSSPFAGRIFDLYGPRYLLLAGSLLHVFGLMMTSLSTKYYQILLSQGVVSAIGVAMIFQPAISSLAGWFSKKAGLAYGISASGSSIGGIIFPIMLSRLVPQVGFPWAMRTSAFMILALLAFANFSIKARNPPNPRPMNRKTILGPLREVRLVLVMAGFLFLTFGIFIPINYITVEAIADGMSLNLAQYMLPILNAASLFGRLGSGAFADKLGPYNTASTVTAFAGILVLALYIPAASNAPLIAFAALFGFASGAYVALAGPLVIRISPLPEIGYRTGLLFMFASIGGLTTNPIAGAILAAGNGSFTGVKIFSGVMIMTGVCFIVLSRMVSTNWKIMTVF